MKTKILGPGVADALTNMGYEFATAEDAAKAMMKIVSDTSINGQLRQSDKFLFDDLY